MQFSEPREGWSVSLHRMGFLHVSLALLFASTPFTKEFVIDGVKRTALVYAPSRQGQGAGAPMVLVFHGHGGTAGGTAAKFRIQDEWPDALVVYPQGLPTEGIYDPDGKKAGWQKEPGKYGDRDLELVDAIISWAKREYKIDAGRVFATGHSNGGAFTYLLWHARAEYFAGYAPSAAAINLRGRPSIPEPALIIAGENDRLVSFAVQKASIEAILRLNGCSGSGQEWAKYCSLYAGKQPVVTYVHPGGHEVAPDAGKLIVRFFRDVVR